MSNSQDNICLQLYWLLIYYQDADPQFDIVKMNNLISNSWETLQRGARVLIKDGTEGVVLLVSDSLKYLLSVYSLVTEEFLTEREQQMKIEKQDTQIDKKKLRKEMESLKDKHDSLKNNFDYVTRKCALVKADYVEEDLKTPKKHKGGATVNESDDDIENDEIVFIGICGTQIPKHIYNSVNWLSHSAATRKLLVAVFGKYVLATHSLTGKPSPAFIGVHKETKAQLNPTKIRDIVIEVSKRCKVSESMVRSAITTKCADENKMLRKRNEKQKKSEN